MRHIQPYLKRAKMKIIKLSLLVGILLIGCVASNPNSISNVTSNQEFFSDVEQTTDESYGFTAENPVTIKNADLNSSIGSSYYYLSQIRTENGNRLHLINRFSINNPNYQKPAIALQNRYTGESLNNGTGSFLDIYILKPESESDTLKIYINPYLKGTVKIPVGLKFEHE